jgi:hypothetical protein
MESYSKLTETELLREMDKCKEQHEGIKGEIMEITTDIEEKEKIVNSKLEQLENVEKIYVDLLQEMTNRK